MLNLVAIQGRVVADPELKQTTSGVNVCRFRIAVDRSFSKDKKADFFTVTAWRNTAEFVSKYFSKGDMIIINGELQTNEFTDKDGNKRSNLEILAGNVNFGGKSNGAHEAHTDAPAAPTLEDVSGFAVVDSSEDLPF